MCDSVCVCVCVCVRACGACLKCDLIMTWDRRGREVSFVFVLFYRFLFYFIFFSILKITFQAEYARCF